MNKLTKFLKQCLNVMVCCADSVMFYLKKNLDMLYKALILPHLDYCDAVWGNAGKIQLKILDRLQNAAGKIILGLPRRYPTEILLNTLRWDNLENRRNLHLNILVYKSLTNTLPSPLCKIFLPVSNNHGHKTLVGLTHVLMEVAYSCNFLAVSDSSTCPDIGTS